MHGRVLIGGAMALLAAASSAQEEHWIGSWGASPEPPRLQAAGPFTATRSFENQTVRQFVRISAGGDGIRLRLTNRFGSRPVDVGAVSVARVGFDGEPIADMSVAVTFAGETTATMAAGAPLLSDPIDLAVDALESLAISIYFPNDAGPCTCHATGMRTALISEQGDFTSRPIAATETIQARAFLAGVDVLADGQSQTIVILGDSITDGIGSTLDTNRRWPDRLAERFAAAESATRWGIVNAGISGNRVLSDGAGVSALARFDEDVLAVPGVTHVIVFEGVNDLGFEYGRLEGPLAAIAATMPRARVTAASMIAGYRQLIDRAHAQGLTIFGATIAPYEGAAYHSSEGEAVRQEINQWIRESGEFDAVLDFDAVLRDPAQPGRFANGLHSGDFLHGSDTGYRRIADSVDLELFD